MEKSFPHPGDFQKDDTFFQQIPNTNMGSPFGYNLKAVLEYRDVNQDNQKDFLPSMRGN